MAHDQEDQQSEASPHQLLVEGGLGLGLLNLREERHEWLDQIEESYCKAEVCILAVCHLELKLTTRLQEIKQLVVELRARATRQRESAQLTAAHDGRLLYEMYSSRESSKNKKREREASNNRLDGRKGGSVAKEGKIGLRKRSQQRQKVVQVQTQL